MRLATLILSGATIVSLNLIMLIAGAFPDPESIQPIFDGLIRFFDLSLVSSSGLLAFRLFKDRSWLFGSVFVGNLGILTVALILRTRGVVFPRWLFSVVDLYWLNLYLICCSWKFRSLFTPRV